MAKSTAALAAQMIRKEIKSAFPGLAFTCTSQTYAGGNSIDVGMTDQTPAIKQAVEAITAKYQEGKFDGMNDIYEYTNSRSDIPQVKYLFVSNQMTPALKQQAYNEVRGYWSGAEAILPETYEAGCNIYVPSAGAYASELVWRAFCAGELDSYGAAA